MSPLDFGRINSGSASKKQTDPRKIFTTLKRDSSKFKRPLDEQADVLDAWFLKRTQGDTTLKMNTGAGKTVVGLLCLQSCINEGVGPAVYVAPDNYLLKQVVKEAKALGIATTEDPFDSAYASSEAILVINVWRLFGGRSVFGVGRDGVKLRIGSIVIDDAHACLATVAEQFKIALVSTHPAYAPLLALFREDLATQSVSGVKDIEAEDPHALMVVPFWSWKARQKEVVNI